MKRVLVVILVLLLFTAAASASQDNWRISIKTNNDGLDGYNPVGMQLGVYPTSIDGPDSQDGSQYPALGSDIPGTDIHVASPIGAQLYGKNIKAATFPKTWDFFVAGNVNSPAGVIRLSASTVGPSYLPLPYFNGMSIAYYIRMLDNKGVEGAPANGTLWQLPIPTTHSNSVPFWTAPIDLPVIKLSSRSNAAFMAEGYRLQFMQGMIPEPSSLLALGAGLLGLAGVIRRRR